MTESSKYKERNIIGENFRDLRVSDQIEDEDISLHVKVNVRRQDSSTAEEVYLGKFENCI